MRRLLVQPLPFVDHLKRSKGLLRLIVVVELPRQIADCENQNCQGGDNPNCALITEQALCHFERRRVSKSQNPEIRFAHFHSLNLWSSRPCRAFPSRSILDSAALR